MAAVFVDITMSLDGFVAGPGVAPGTGLAMAMTGVVASPFVTHLQYRIVK